uniref:ATP synthase complex subunit 8 n=1 Tax=Somanniathelphusa bawangensis TaxID=2682932 RepID=A0A650FER2_9EUCA|nr:ATP synthase F0 subunit 8 [Somanniathelphusa hainanensis]QGT77247.1 ATP synthase F0 subunit 8 [Somanniathelphusa bawangensis]UIB42757.1 ATP synthase F0 subunit 8 [Somanniathelphusa hainanensis]
MPQMAPMFWLFLFLFFLFVLFLFLTLNYFFKPTSSLTLTTYTHLNPPKSWKL